MYMSFSLKFGFMIQNLDKQLDKNLSTGSISGSIVD